MVKLNEHLKASTLLESIIAMVIVLVCFTIATMIFVNITNSDKQRLKLKALTVLNREAIETKKSNLLLDEEKIIHPFTVKKVVERFPETDNLYKLLLIAKDSTGKTIAVRNELITSEAD